MKLKANDSSQLPYLNLIPGSKKTQSINSLCHVLSSSGSNSNTSISNSNFNRSETNSSYEDDDECFYDAIDAADNEIYTMINNRDKESNNCVYKNVDTSSGDEDVDDSKQCFYDTASTRHSYESDIHKIDIHETDKSSGKTEGNVIEADGEKCASDIDEEDCEDAELETPWSFWIDKCIRGTTKNEYEAGLKLIHTVDTVQVYKITCFFQLISILV